MIRPDPGATPAQLSLRVLIVCEHASAQFGGEAILPLHYFRVLRQRGVDVWLVTHSRTRAELARLFGAEPRIHYVEDTLLHKLMWRIGRRLPAQIAYFTTGFVSRFAAQLTQRAIVRRLVASERISVVHQPMPVSPREPSMMFGFGVPVVIGPMNGGMEYPPAFRRSRGRIESTLLRLGRWSAQALNALMPGKRQAAVLLVANGRTREALPRGVCPRVVELAENGVDLTLWRPEVGGGPAAASSAHGDVGTAATTTFVYLGRLVDWKAVDLLLHAFKAANASADVRLLIIGDGTERARLEGLATELGIASGDGPQSGKVRFTGFLAQHQCAEQLRRADCLVLPSLLECGGAVVLEAMSLGKPVIATAWGGPLDYLDASCGVLVPPSGRELLVQGLAQAMVRLAQSPQLRQVMGRKGREKILRDYDWEVKVDRMLEVYRAACESSGGGAGSVPSGRI